MGRWLKKVQEAQGRAPTQPDSVSYVSSFPGAFAKNDPPPACDPSGPAHDIDTIIEVLVRQVGRPLGWELENLMRQVMRPMSRVGRAGLAAKVDDCFEYAESAQEGRQQVETLLRQVIPHDEVHCSLSDALSWIAERCKLTRDDRHFLGLRLALMSQVGITKTAELYVTTWLAAAVEEPLAHRRDNAGRRAANVFLRGVMS